MLMGVYLLTVLYVALVICSFVRICCNSVMRTFILLKVLCMHSELKWMSSRMNSIMINVTDHNEVKLLLDHTQYGWRVYRANLGVIGSLMRTKLL